VSGTAKISASASAVRKRKAGGLKERPIGCPNGKRLAELQRLELVSTGKRRVSGGLDEAALGSFDEAALRSFDEAALGSFDEAALGSFDEAALRSFDEAAAGALGMHVSVDGVDLDFVDSCVLDDEAAGRE
jgi:hypothetical protein